MQNKQCLSRDRSFKLNAPRLPLSLSLSLSGNVGSPSLHNIYFRKTLLLPEITPCPLFFSYFLLLFRLAGKYVLSEDIEFSPPLDPKLSPNAHLYTDRAFVLGFFAAIIVKGDVSSIAGRRSEPGAL